MPNHIIQNYDQVKLRLEQLSKDYNKRSRDYYFAVGDLLNECVDDTVDLAQLLEDTGTELSQERARNLRWVARRWPPSERTFDVPFEVYRLLAKHKDLIQDGMSSSKAAAMVSARGTRECRRDTSIQSLRLSINILRSVVERDDGSPMTAEKRALIEEAHSLLETLAA